MILSANDSAVVLTMAEALSVNGYGNLHSREVSPATRKEVAHG